MTLADLLRNFEDSRKATNARNRLAYTSELTEDNRKVVPVLRTSLHPHRPYARRLAISSIGLGVESKHNGHY